MRRLFIFTIAVFLGLITTLRTIDTIENFIKQKGFINPVLQDTFFCFNYSEMQKLNDLYLLLFLVIFLYFIALILLLRELMEHAEKKEEKEEEIVFK